MTFIEQIDSWLAAIFGGPAAPVSKPPSPAGKADPLSASGTPPAGASGKPPARKKGAKFGAATGTLAKGASGKAADYLDLNAQLKARLENARDAEWYYDRLKNREGGSQVLVAVAESTGLEAGGRYKSLDVRYRSSKVVAYTEHEKAINDAIAWARSEPIYKVTRSSHVGEEYTWSHVAIAGPGFVGGA